MGHQPIPKGTLGHQWGLGWDSTGPYLLSPRVRCPAEHGFKPNRVDTCNAWHQTGSRGYLGLKPPPLPAGQEEGSRHVIGRDFSF